MTLSLHCKDREFHPSFDTFRNRVYLLISTATGSEMSGTASRAVEVPCPGTLLQNAVQEAQCQVLETQKQNVSFLLFLFLKFVHCIFFCYTPWMIG